MPNRQLPLNSTSPAWRSAGAYTRALADSSAMDDGYLLNSTDDTGGISSLGIGVVDLGKDLPRGAYCETGRILVATKRARDRGHHRAMREWRSLRRANTHALIQGFFAHRTASHGSVHRGEHVVPDSRSFRSHEWMRDFSSGEHVVPDSRSFRSHEWMRNFSSGEHVLADSRIHHLPAEHVRPGTGRRTGDRRFKGVSHTGGNASRMSGRRA